MNEHDITDFVDTFNAAARAGCPMRSITKAIRAGVLRSYKPATLDRELIRVRDLEAWITNEYQYAA